jgi:uncharacterized membrane protein
VIVAAWIVANLLAPAIGLKPIDPPPFSWLAGGVSLLSLYMVVLVLATQRREDQLVHRRELLTLELAILTEQKTAKVIELLEEVRRDSPFMRNRVDHEAQAMAQPADPKSVLDAIKETNVKVDPAGGSAT